MTTPTPSGVFVRLPLTNEQLGKLLAPTGTLNERLISIGTPVTGDDIPVITMLGTLRDPIPCVRQSDHLAALASLQGEVGRLREYYEASEAINKVGILEATPEMYDRESRARKALKGQEA